MKIPQSLKSMSPTEMGLFLVFVLYILLPMKTPCWMKPYVNSAMGMLFFFCVTVALFVYTNPILGVLYLLVVYEAIRRSSDTLGNPRAIVLEYEPSQAQKDIALKKMNPLRNEKTVEEEVIEIRAPIDKPPVVDIVQTSFKPVAEPIVGASKYNN